MNKLRFYRWVIAVLVLLNITVVCAFVFGPKGRGKARRPMETVIEKLHFDAGQVQRYDEIIRTSRAKADEKDRQIVVLKNELYRHLNEPLNPLLLDSLSTHIALIHKELEQMHYRHFMDIRGLCRPDQLPYFQELSQDITEIFARRPSPAPLGEHPRPH